MKNRKGKRANARRDERRALHDRIPDKHGYKQPGSQNPHKGRGDRGKR